MQNLEKETKILRDMAQTTQENQIKGATQLANLQESINFVNEKSQKYEQDRREKEREIKELKENISALSKSLNDFDSVFDKEELLVPPMRSIEQESNKNTDQCGIKYAKQVYG